MPRNKLSPRFSTAAFKVWITGLYWGCAITVYNRPCFAPPTEIPFPTKSVFAHCPTGNVLLNTGPYFFGGPRNSTVENKVVGQTEVPWNAVFRIEYCSVLGLVLTRQYRWCSAHRGPVELIFKSKDGKQIFNVVLSLISRDGCEGGCSF